MATSTPVNTQKESAVKKVFKSHTKFGKYIFKNGKEAPFVAGRYITDIKSEIEELEHEVSLSHPIIFIDANEKEVDASKLDPVEEIKRKAIAEFIVSQAAANSKTNDRGNYTQERLNVASSSTIAEGAAGSDSGASLVDLSATSRLASLAAFASTTSASTK